MATLSSFLTFNSISSISYQCISHRCLLQIAFLEKQALRHRLFFRVYSWDLGKRGWRSRLGQKMLSCDTDLCWSYGKLYSQIVPTRARELGLYSFQLHQPVMGCELPLGVVVTLGEVVFFSWGNLQRELTAKCYFLAAILEVWGLILEVRVSVLKGNLDSSSQ